MRFSISVSSTFRGVEHIFEIFSLLTLLLDRLEILSLASWNIRATILMVGQLGARSTVLYHYTLTPIAHDHII
jgi:hypothetical protein